MTTPNDFDTHLDDSTTPAVVQTFPVAQWINGNNELEALGGFPFTGGWAIPLFREKGRETVPNIPEGLIPEGFTLTQHKFKQGGKKSVLAATRASVAVIRIRRMWFKKIKSQDGNEREVTFAWKHFEGAGREAIVAAGARGRYQALLAFKGAPQHIFQCTFTGTNSQKFETALTDLSAKLCPAVSRALGMKKIIQPFGVWATLQPGPHAKPNNGYPSETTPPMLVMPENVSAADCVGRDNWLFYQATYKLAEAWAHEWDNLGPRPMVTPVVPVPTTEPEF